MHGFDATDKDARATEIFEPEHRSCSSFDGPMVLRNDVVQVLALADLDRRLALRIHDMQGRKIGTALIDGDRLWNTVLADRLLEETPGGSLVTMGPPQEVDGVAGVWQASS